MGRLLCHGVGCRSAWGLFLRWIGAVSVVKTRPGNLNDFPK
jgi:hypothetical protein